MSFRKLPLALLGALVLFGCSSSNPSSEFSSSDQKEGKMYRLDEYNSVFAAKDTSAAD